MILNDFDQNTISGILVIARYLHDNAANLSDFNVLYDAGDTGLKARLAAMSNGGQDALDELGGLHGMKVGELNDIAYIVTSLVQPIVTNARVPLAHVRKAT